MREKRYDVLILGGGPAGVSAAIWADELGLSSAIVDRGRSLGGQLENVHNPIKNFSGSEFENGAEMSAFLAGQMKERSTELLLNEAIVRVDLSKKQLHFSNGETVSGNALVLATGVRRRKLGVPGEDEFYGNGILNSGAKNPSAATGKTVAIVGGGDSALENALILSDHAERIFLVHRRGEFSGRKEFVDRILAAKNIEIFFNSTIAGFMGSNQLGSIALRHLHKKSVEEVPVDLALVRIGYDPNSELFLGQTEVDETGYLMVDREGKTSVSGVYAIGDVCRPHAQSISSAVGDGASAIFSIIANL